MIALSKGWGQDNYIPSRNSQGCPFVNIQDVED